MKTQSKGPSQPSSPQPEALDEKITHLTEEVAKTANRYKVPALIGLVLVMAIIAIATLMKRVGEKSEGELSDSVYVLFQKDDAGLFKKGAAEIRAEAPALGKKLEGEKIEPVFAARYAAWLFGQTEGNDRNQALTVLKDALGRHEGNLILTIAHEELSTVQAASAGFILPPIPEPDPPVELTPVFPEITPPVGAPPAGTAPAETGSTDTNGSTPSTTEPTSGEDVVPPSDVPPTSPASGDDGR